MSAKARCSPNNIYTLQTQPRTSLAFTESHCQDALWENKKSQFASRQFQLDYSPILSLSISYLPLTTCLPFTCLPAPGGWPKIRPQESASQVLLFCVANKRRVSVLVWGIVGATEEEGRQPASQWATSSSSSAALVCVKVSEKLHSYVSAESEWAALERDGWMQVKCVGARESREKRISITTHRQVVYFYSISF